MLALVDNYDSFTYNLVHAFYPLTSSVRVFRNDELSCEALFALKPDYLVIGPGPGSPSRAGFSKEYIKRGSLPTLGICLGHQAIGEVFGARVERAARPMHGKTSRVFHTQTGIFKNVPQGFYAARYHSLLINPHSLPACLEAIAWSQEGEIMAIRHKTDPIVGVQFHPESIATPEGIAILKNFFKLFNSNNDHVHNNHRNGGRGYDNQDEGLRLGL